MGRLLVVVALLSPHVVTAQEYQLVPVLSLTDAGVDSKLRSPSDVFVDEKNHEIYVVDSGNKRVVVYNMEGFFQYQFALPAGVGEATGLVVNDRDEVLIAVGGKVAVCDFRGSLLEYVNFYGFPGAEGMNVTRLKIDKNNDYYALDAGKRRVVAFDSDWNYRLEIGGEDLPTIKKEVRGKEQERPMVKSLSIGDICVDDEGLIYLVDSMASYVFVFNDEGKFLRSIGEPGSAFNTLSLPNGVAVDSQGHVLVVDTTSHGLLGYDKEGRLLFALGGLGQGKGRLYFPKFISTDRDGGIYIVEPFIGRVQVLNLRRFGSSINKAERVVNISFG